MTRTTLNISDSALDALLGDSGLTACTADTGALKKPGGESGTSENPQRRVLRTIEMPDTCFAQRPLAILEACRVTSQTGLALDPPTLQAMKSHKMRLVRIEASVLADELTSLLLGDYVHDALVDVVDVLVAILPEIAACRGFDQHTPYHIYDVWEHTAWVVQNCPPAPLVRWAALLHDLGKPAACFFEGERAHFYGHPLLSTILARDILRRLEMEASFTERVLALVRMHDDKIAATPASVAQAIEALGGDVALFRALCHLKLADALAQSRLSAPRIQLARDLERVLDDL